MADIINITTRERVTTPTPSHRDTGYILSDDDWHYLAEMFDDGCDREEIELFIMEAVSRD